jgi:hypothetical protein
LTNEMLAEFGWKLDHRPVSHWVTGRRWNIANNYLTLTFEVYCTSN